jgi:hypothetical protein
MKLSKKKIKEMSIDDLKVIRGGIKTPIKDTETISRSASARSSAETEYETPIPYR